MTRAVDSAARLGPSTVVRLRRYGLAITGLGLLLALVAYGFMISAAPDFEVGIVRYTRPAVLAEGVAIQRNCDGGAVEIRADKMRPGHEKIRGMLVGPSSFIALEQLDVLVTRSGQPDCRIRGGMGELKTKTLTITGEPTIVIQGVPSPTCKEVVVDLSTASVRFR
jgi:hypothetical protein